MSLFTNCPQCDSFHLKLILFCSLTLHLKMMTNQLILIALILCVSSMDSLKLSNICKQDTFEYNGLVMNSFYKIPQRVSLDPNQDATHYIINSNVQSKNNNKFSPSNQFDFPSVGSFCFNEIDVHFPNETDQAEFEYIKRNHTNTIVELLSETNLNNRKFIFETLDDRENVLKELRTRLVNLKDRYPTENYDNLLNPNTDLIKDAIDFVDFLQSSFYNHFPRKDHLKLGIKMDEEMKKLGDLIRNLDVSNEAQTMVFHNISIGEIYHKQIALVSNFTLNRRSKLIYDFRSTSTLYYDVVLPFHDKNYDATSTDCTSKWDLPEFLIRTWH